MLVARCRLKQSYDHPSICTTKFSYTYPGSHNSQVFNLLHCSHRPLDSLNMRTGVMWRMCVYKDWCGDCNEMRNRALLRYWGCFFPSLVLLRQSVILPCPSVRVSLHTTESFPLVWFSRDRTVIFLLCSPRTLAHLACAFRNKVNPIFQ